MVRQSAPRACRCSRGLSSSLCACCERQMHVKCRPSDKPTPGFEPGTRLVFVAPAFSDPATLSDTLVTHTIAKSRKVHKAWLSHVNIDKSPLNPQISSFRDLRCQRLNGGLSRRRSRVRVPSLPLFKGPASELPRHWSDRSCNRRDERGGCRAR